MIVGHEERLPGEDRWLDADFEELYRLGSLTDAEWEQFGEIGQVAADMRRRAYLLFDASGDFERMVGLGGDPGLTAIGAHLAQRGTDALITGPAGPERTFLLASRRGMTA